MRFTLSKAVLLGLLAAAPLIQGAPHGTSPTHRDLSISGTSEFATRDVIVDDGTDEPIKRRSIWDIIGPRGIPRLGDKPPKDRDPPTTSGPGRTNPPDNEHGSPGSTTKPAAFADANKEKARAKGEKLENDLVQTIFNDKPDTGSKTPVVSTTLEYKAVSKKSAPIGPNNGDYLKEFGIQGTNKETWKARLIYKDNGESSKKAPIVETTQDIEQGAIAVKQSWNKERDPSPKAPWTQMVMDNWRSTSGDKVKDLKYMIRDNIQEIDTRDSSGIVLNTPVAIREAYSKMGANTHNSLTLNPKSTKADEVAAYELMAAQTHVARVLQLLKDYHQELGNLRITKIHLTHVDHDVARSYNIVIEFGH
ncbi:hypothetical protein AAE478_002641 [Parahypoxylon ruwenzoriense]